MAGAFDSSEPGFDVQQGCSKPAMLLIGVAPGIHLATALLDQRVDGLDAVRCFEQYPDEWVEPKPMQGQGFFPSFKKAVGRRLVDALEL